MAVLTWAVWVVWAAWICNLPPGTSTKTIRDSTNPFQVNLKGVFHIPITQYQPRIYNGQNF